MSKTFTNKELNIDKMTFNLEKELEKFDAIRWSVACREMQIRLIHGNVDSAVRILREFALNTKSFVATLESNVCEVFPLRIANMLDELGCTTVMSVDKINDSTLLAIPNVSNVTVMQIRRIIKEIKAGLVPSISKDEECLIDQDYIATIEQQIYLFCLHEGPQNLQSICRELSITGLQAQDAVARSKRINVVSGKHIAKAAPIRS